MTQRNYGVRYGVTRSHVVDGRTVIDEVHVMDVAELIAAARAVEDTEHAELARRVCARAHIHDTADQAHACDQPPGPV